MKRFLYLSWFAFLCSFLHCAEQKKWEGDGLELTLSTLEDDLYEGELIFGDQIFGVDARYEGAAFNGTFGSNDSEHFPFVLTENSDGSFTFDSDGNVYVLQMQKDSTPNPLARKPANRLSKSPEIEQEGIEPDISQKISYKTHRHPSGYFFSLPETWQITENQMGMILLADDAPRDAQGNPLELMIASAVPAPNLTDPMDPQIGVFFDNEYRTYFPDFTRKPEVIETTNALGKTAIYTYTGPLPGGEVGLHHIYVTLHDNIGVYLIHLGKEDAVLKRQKTVEQLWKSLDKEPAQIDPSLIRSWSQSDFESSSGYGNTISSTTRHVWEFSPSGRVIYAYKTFISGTVDEGMAGGSYDGSWNVFEGSVRTEGETLFVVWDTGETNEYEYRVFQDHQGVTSLKLKRSDWKKSNYYQ